MFSKRMRGFCLLLGILFCLTLPGYSEGSKKSVNAGKNENEMIIIRYSMPSTWNDLNVMYPGSAYSQEVGNFIFDRPAKLDGLSFVPCAAESWEMSDDYTAITFHLRKDFYFHDGEQVTTEDWLLLLQLMTNPAVKSIAFGQFRIIKGTDNGGLVQPGSTLGVDVIDDFTLTVHLKRPMSDYAFLENVGLYWWILPAHLLKDKNPADYRTWDFWSHPIGSGPCKFVKEQAGVQLVLDANKDYPIGDIQFDRIIMTVVDPSTVVTALMSRETDYDIFGLTYDEASILDGLDGITVDLRKGPGSTTFLLYNNDKLPFEIRKALDLSLDKEKIVESLLSGYGEAAATGLLSTNPFFLDLYEGQQIAKAKKYLDSIGYNYNRVLKLATTGGSRKQQAVVMQQMWAEAGIKVEVQTGDVPTCIGGMIKGTFDIVLISAIATNAPSWHAAITFGKGSPAHVDHTLYDPYVASIEGALNKEQLKKAADEFTRFVYDHTPVSYVFHQFKFYPHADWLSGMKAIGMDNCYEWVIDREKYFK